jgi:hypothetical protein
LGSRVRVGGDVWLWDVALEVEWGQFGKSLHPFVVHGPGFDLGEPWLMVADDFRSKRGEQPRCLPSLTERTFRIFDSGVDRLRDLKLFGALFTTVFVEGHDRVSCCPMPMHIPTLGHVGLAEEALIALDRPIRLRLL